MSNKRSFQITWEIDSIAAHSELRVPPNGMVLGLDYRRRVNVETWIPVILQHSNCASIE